MQTSCKHLLRAVLLIFATVASCRTGTASESSLSAVWAASDRDKVAREELRASRTTAVFRDGSVELFAAKNEVVAFSLILEAARTRASDVQVSLERLIGPDNFSLQQKEPGNPFNYVGRAIELFYVRYLPINGLSKFAYETYDERHIPRRFRRKWSAAGRAVGTFDARPHGGYHYPDIAVPLEAVKSFDIPAKTNQAIWVDIYVPKTAPAGTYRGNILVSEGAAPARRIPIRLRVKNFALPDQPALGTMLYMSNTNITRRYLGKDAGSSAEDYRKAQRIRDRHFQMAHRHKISMIGDLADEPWPHKRPRPEWETRLSGELFTPQNGYWGPGTGTANAIYAIGTYGSWDFSRTDKQAFTTDLLAWSDWFAAHSPNTEVFLYLIDESDDYPSIERWASWMDAASTTHPIASMATCNLAKARQLAPSLDWPCNVGVGLSPDPDRLEQIAKHYRDKKDKQLCFYNGRRPFVGSFAIEDDGTALQAIAYAQYKKGIDRWFYWESTYYNNYQGGTGQTNVFQNPQTFGAPPKRDPVLGLTSWMYGNGDGVLFYPGTDKVFPAESYGLDGPIASLRLKYWRRGIQDGDYLALAGQIDPQKTDKIVNGMVPKVLWEYGVSDPSDPTWVRTDLAWDTNPKKWEDARRALTQIIVKKSVAPAPSLSK